MGVLYYHPANSLSHVFPPRWSPYPNFLRPKVLENWTIISLISAIIQISASFKWKTHNAALTARNFPEISQKVIYMYRMYPYLTQTGVPDL